MKFNGFSIENRWLFMKIPLNIFECFRHGYRGAVRPWRGLPSRVLKNPKNVKKNTKNVAQKTAPLKKTRMASAFEAGAY